MFKKNKNKILSFDKPTVIVVEVIIGVVALLSALGIKYLVTFKKNAAIRLENQVVENITFSDFKIKVSNGISKLNVELINYTAEDIEVDEVVINLYAKDRTVIYKMYTQFDSDVNNVLKPNQSLGINNETTTDLSQVSYVEYEVVTK